MPCCAYRFSRLSATIWSHDTQTTVRQSVLARRALFRLEAAVRGWGQYLSDVLAHVLNHHFISCNGLHGEQAPLVDPAASEPQLLLSELSEEKLEEAFLIINNTTYVCIQN